MQKSDLIELIEYFCLRVGILPNPQEIEGIVIDWLDNEENEVIDRDDEEDNNWIEELYN